ncbi:ScbA/BarX family gamma-butyrolactone biosynthesis protein [Blastococcus saxobsidens]|uniref:Putative lactone biosynthesis protein n=1 Tax=Blastococcus saxobsidens (strain DD2) TaxID=1146883 RepID=H6RRQ4_BLASD|nr:ScbA/BarX family gamma-butyrolactone biosynthesis protein [Blastococcus saxobsidens]CCG01697.1 putative lactone biosynthesis protein [Blastococcus saxobsidens DD2]
MPPRTSPTLSAVPDDAAVPWSPVGQHLVHKAAAAEVLVTDFAAVTPTLAAVATRWPAAHPRYDRRTGTAGHLLLLAETIRQAGLCLAHLQLGIPVGEQFIFHRIAVRLAAPVAALGETAPDRTVTTVEPTPRYRVGRPAGAVLAVEIRHGGDLWATAEADYSSVPRRVYDRLRASARDHATAGSGRPVPSPRDAGPDRRTQAGVERSRVLVDLADPTFFDHEVDHLPGMLLIDAVLTAAAARAGSGAALAGIDVTFDRFAELDRPTWVRTGPAPGTDEQALAVALEQGSGPVARGRVLLG